jgi:glycosyltransferase involved in cell wall biosynthesis
MILLHTVPYLRRREHFTTADKFGAWVAHQDIVKATLQYSSIEGIHFFLPFFREYDKAEIPYGIEELKQEFPHHQIEVKKVSDLHDLARRSRYALADDFESFTSLALSRYAGQECLFPVSTIVHTIPRRIAFIDYSTALLFAEPFDAIVTTSEAGRRTVKAIFEDMEEFVVSKLKADITRKPNIIKIPLAVDEQFLRPRDPQAARLELGLPADSTIILYLGRLSETFKADLEPLLSTFRRLQSENSDLYFVIAGQDIRDSYGPVVRSLAQQFGIDDRVKVITNFPYMHKPLLYSACDIFVSPVDNIQETFGLSVIEAMASGLPVVASDWSGYRDLVIHNETGFLARTIWNAEASRMAEVVAPFPTKTEHFLAQQTVVDMEDLHRYLKVLIDNKELRRQFGNKGRDQVISKFCWPVVIKLYQELWEEQWRQINSRSQKVDCGLPLNYNKQFGHFATTFLQKSMVFRASPHRDAFGDIQDIAGRKIPYPIESQEVRRVISQCRTQPQSVEELLTSGNETTMSAVTWLWKKGYLEPAH